MSESATINNQTEFTTDNDQSENLKDRKRTLHPGFKRNMRIIFIALFVAIAFILFTIIGAKSLVDDNKNKISGSSIPTKMGTATEATPTLSEAERLKRVQEKESEEARKARDTYIPKDNPLTVDKLAAPPAQDNGSGQGYNYTLNSRNDDAQRDASIRKGLDVQLAAILRRAEPPPVQIAAAYPVPAVPSGPASANQEMINSPGSEPTPESLVTALSIAGARLVSPYDSEKTGYVSAVITAGPLNGAFVTGQAVLNPNEGVQMKFTRMKFDQEDFVIDAVALDAKTSSDAMSAEIDRKLFSRYVLPIAFVAGQAYMGALAKPAQAITTLGAGLTTTQAVVTPAATTLQATAAAAGAGLGQAVAKLGAQIPSAYLPVDTSIALLFNAAVIKKVKPNGK